MYKGIVSTTVRNSLNYEETFVTETVPFMVIVGAVSSITIVILIIMLVVMLCHRKTNKSDVKKPDITEVGKSCDPFKDSDRNSNISDLKLELRQVEGSCDMVSNSDKITNINVIPFCVCFESIVFKYVCVCDNRFMVMCVFSIQIFLSGSLLCLLLLLLLYIILQHYFYCNN